MTRIPPRDFAADALQRLAAASALEEAAGYGDVESWRLAARLPTSVRLQLCAANRTPDRTKAREDVERILSDYRRGLQRGETS